MAAMKWIGTAALMVAFAGLFSLPATLSEAQTAPRKALIAQVSQAPPGFESERRIRRPRARVRIYPPYVAEPDGVFPRYYPGPDALRVCNATYVQEYRPSGTVIVPHMTCVWRRG
jgi:hypothetical protein